MINSCLAAIASQMLAGNIQHYMSALNTGASAGHSCYPLGNRKARTAKEAHSDKQGVHFLWPAKRSPDPSHSQELWLQSSVEAA